MSTYICTACSNNEKGQYRFTVKWTDTNGSAFVTRCPRCGALEDELEYL